jgi:hypothetical protein
MKRWVVAGLLISALTAVLVRENATQASVVALSIEELTQGADLCVRGSVIDKQSSWIENGGMIETTFTIAPTEFLKGTPSSTVKVRVLGGDLDGMSIRAGEAPTYGLGEDVVVFGKLRPDGDYTTFGWFQGKLTLLNNEVREMLNTDWNELRTRIQRAQ